MKIGQRNAKLEALHNRYTENLSGDQLINYLLESMCYMKHLDVEGWLNRFQPVTKTVLPKKKKRKISPSQICMPETQKCLGCKKESLVEDVLQGTVVCFQCGLIHHLHALSSDVAHTNYTRLSDIDRHVVHRYSRVVYFRSIVMGMQAETKVDISPDHLLLLRRRFDGKSCDPVVMKRAIKELCLPIKLVHHKNRLCELVSSWRAPVFDAVVLLQMYKDFLKLEYYWDNDVKKTSARKSFPSYKFVFYQLCFHHGVDWCGADVLPKSKSILRTLSKLYDQLASKARLKNVWFK